MALVDELIAELAPGAVIPTGIDKDKLFRGLLAVQEPQEFSPAFYQKQDRYLQEQLRAKGVTKLEDLKPVSDHLLRIGPCTQTGKSGLLLYQYGRISLSQSVGSRNCGQNSACFCRGTSTIKDCF